MIDLEDGDYKTDSEAEDYRDIINFDVAMWIISILVIGF
jgi:hypothetical protein